jgi:hypothetical protein
MLSPYTKSHTSSAVACLDITDMFVTVLLLPEVRVAWPLAGNGMLDVIGRLDLGRSHVYWFSREPGFLSEAFDSESV